MKISTALVCVGLLAGCYGLTVLYKQHRLDQLQYVNISGDLICENLVHYTNRWHDYSDEISDILANLPEHGCLDFEGRTVRINAPIDLRNVSGMTIRNGTLYNTSIDDAPMFRRASNSTGSPK